MFANKGSFEFDRIIMFAGQFEGHSMLLQRKNSSKNFTELNIKFNLISDQSLRYIITTRHCICLEFDTSSVWPRD